MASLPVQLLEIIDKREPTEEEVRDLPATIADDSGEWGRILLTQVQVDILKAKRLIYYCGHCTQTAIRVGISDVDQGDEYAVREYHTEKALHDVDDYQVYIDQIIAASNM